MLIEIISVGDVKYTLLDKISKLNGLQLGELTESLDAEVRINGVYYKLTVPAGFKTDFGTIPKFLHWFLDPMGENSETFTLHDWLWATELWKSRKADRLMYALLRNTGHSICKSLSAYLIVRLYRFLIYPFIKQKRKELVEINSDVIVSYYNEGI